MFLKAGGWQTVMLHTRFNPNAYWYSFDFLGKVSLIQADEILPRGIGPFLKLIYFSQSILYFCSLKKGVMHADEIMYLFTMPIPHNETEIELSKKNARNMDDICQIRVEKALLNYFGKIFM